MYIAGLKATPPNVILKELITVNINVIYTRMERE